MVCDRCVMAVRNTLEQMNIPFQDVGLGEVTLSKSLAPEQAIKFEEKIKSLGFELIEDRTARIVSSIKTAVLDFIRKPASENRHLKFSVYLSDRMHKEYNYLSTLFSDLEGTTIEQHLIHQKIERVKELLVYDEHSLSEIAHDLGYSSVQHLSNQFKKVTGLTPSHFKQVKENKRKSLDKI